MDIWNNILLADDDEDDKLIFIETVKSINPKINVEMTGDGIELLFTLEQASILPDIIFLDINMPKMSGLECLYQIRLNSRYESIPVVMLTTSTVQEDIYKAYDKGANLYIAKPTFINDYEKILSSLSLKNWSELLSKRSLKNFFIGNRPLSF